MGGNGKRGGSDRVLESRHLVGLFLGVVLLCGVFFTLGYVMGRTQYGSAPVRADGSLPMAAPSKPAPAKAKETPPPVAPANNEWDFYPKKEANHTPPAPKETMPAPAAVPAVATRSPGAPSAAVTKPVAAPGKPTAPRYQPPKLPKGSLVLQVAALKREGDALKMADEIQQKNYPAFVIMMPSDGLYHVQVGPYSDEKSAEGAKHTLEQVGFKSIIKR